MNLKSKNQKMKAKNLLTLALTVMALVVVSGTGRAQGPTGPTQASTCCPPVNGKPMVQAMFKHVGNAANTYTQPLDTASATTASFVTGLNAYLTYLKSVCPQTVKLKAEFFTGPVTAPPPLPLGSPAGPLLGLDAAIPKSSVIFSSLTIAGLNAALNGLGGMNLYPHNNGQHYRIAVKITGVNAAGAPVNCGFNAIECARDDTFGFMYSTTRMSGSPYTN